MPETSASPVLAYVGLGSNLDDPVARIRSGVTALARLAQTSLDDCSSLYRTAPVGLREQPDFVNAVCRLRTLLDPRALMRNLLEIERLHGRVRTGEKGGPRTLDLDLLLHGDATIHSAELILPHPRLHERAFVLYPLHEIEPNLVIPGHGPMHELLKGSAGQRVERLNEIIM